MSAAARAKLDLHFPPSASSSSSSSAPHAPPPATEIAAPAAPDPMRQRVEDLVAQFLERMWCAAKDNITVNGQDAATTTTTTGSQTHGMQADDGEEKEGVHFEYEPYDTRLSARVAGLYAELESLTTQVSRLRRTAPRQAAEAYAGLLEAVLAGAEKTKEEEEFAAAAAAAATGEEKVLKLDPVSDEWQEDVATVYGRGVGELVRLSGLAGGGDGSGNGEGSGGGRGSLTETVGRVQRAKMVALELG
jgi:kinetochor protein Mis14/NSL1